MICSLLDELEAVNVRGMVEMTPERDILMFQAADGGQLDWDTPPAPALAERLWAHEAEVLPVLRSRGLVRKCRWCGGPGHRPCPKETELQTARPAQVIDATARTLMDMFGVDRETHERAIKFANSFVFTPWLQ